jgi:ribosomal protein L11 methyltransferase
MPVGWRLDVELPAAHCDPFEAALAPLAGATAVRLDERRGTGAVSAYFDGEPPRAELAARIAVAAAAAGIEVPEVALASVPDADWVKASEARFPPIVAGRFEIRGSHVRKPAASGRIAIRIDAGMAFGTGLHESTRGCLVALDRLAAGLRPRRMLDLGCGSGILAIAMAKLWGDAVVAADVDGSAVDVAAANARDNGVAGRVRVVQSRGFANPALGRGAPFDLIVANILADPLRRMAPTLTKRLAPGGAAILSGILDGEKAAVEAAYARLSVAPVDEVLLGDWATLVMRRRPGSRGAVRPPPGSG